MSNGEFGLASGTKDDGGFERLWYSELIAPEEVAFEADVFLLTKATAESLASRPEDTGEPQPARPTTTDPPPPVPNPRPMPASGDTTLRIAGTVPSEVWNRIGIKLLPRLRSAKDLDVSVSFSVTVDARSADDLAADLRLDSARPGAGRPSARRRTGLTGTARPALTLS